MLYGTNPFTSVFIKTMEHCPPRQARQRRIRSEIQGIPYNEQRELEKAMRLSLMKMKPKPKPKLKDQKSHSTPKLNVTNPQPPVCLPVPPKIHKVTEPVHKPSPSFIQDDIKPPIAAAKSEGYKKSSRACFKPSSYNTNDSVLIDVLSDDSNYMTSSSSDSDSYEKSKSPKKKKKNKKGNKRITSTTSGSIPETKKSLKKKTHGYSDVEQVQHITFSERYSSDTQSSNDVQILTGITSLQESACQSKSSNKRKNKVILLDISPTVSSSLSTASLPSSEASSCSMDMIIPIDLTKDDIKSPSKKKTFVATTKLKSKKLNKEFTKGNISFEKKKIYKKKNLISSLSKQSTLMQKEFQLTPHVHTDNTSILGGVSGPISTIPTISTSHTDELMSSSINLSGGKLQDISDVNTPFRPCNEGTVSEDMERSPLSSAFQAQRKFAQNQLRTSIMNTDVSSLSADEIIPPKVPKTEDFLLYLCLKSSKCLPENLSVFNSPWTPRKSRQRSRLNQQNERIMRPVALAKKSGTRIHF